MIGWSLYVLYGLLIFASEINTKDAKKLILFFTVDFSHPEVHLTYRLPILSIVSDAVFLHECIDDVRDLNLVGLDDMKFLPHQKLKASFDGIDQSLLGELRHVIEYGGILAGLSRHLDRKKIIIGHVDRGIGGPLAEEQT